MSSYDNVSMACVKCENTICGWGRVSAACIGVPQESQGNVIEFYIAWRVITLMQCGLVKVYPAIFTVTFLADRIFVEELMRSSDDSVLCIVAQ